MAARNQTVSITRTPEEQEEYDQEVMDLAELALSNPSRFARVRSRLNKHEPELIKDVLAKVSELQIAAQKMQLTMQLKKEEERDENFDYESGLDEFLLCINRANQLSKTLFTTRTVNLQGAGDGKKRQRKVELKIGNETLNFIMFRRINLIQEGDKK